MSDGPRDLQLLRVSALTEEKNAENLLVSRDKALAEKYLANRKAHAEHSEPYAGREKGYSETQQPTGQADPVAPTATPMSDGCVASKNSEVFHRADCKSAEKISAKNVVRYATRDEVIQAGKKPCHECNP